MQLCLCRSVLCSLVFWSQAESDITSAGTAPAPSSRVHSGKLHSSCFWLLCHRNHQNFQSCSVSTLFSSSSIRGAIGCLNYYRCSTTNWSHYTVHRAHFFPLGSPSKMKVLLLVQHLHQARKRDWCSFQIAPEICWVFPGAQILHNFCTIFAPTHSFCSRDAFSPRWGMSNGWDKNWWSTLR